MQGAAPQVLGGWLWWYFVAVYVATIGLSAFVAFDSNRRERAAALAKLPEPAWLYRVLQPIFLALVLVVWLPFLPRELSVTPVAIVPFALAIQIAYLLRVVFPKSAAPEADDAGDHGPGGGGS